MREKAEEEDEERPTKTKSRRAKAKAKGKAQAKKGAGKGRGKKRSNDEGDDEVKGKKVRKEDAEQIEEAVPKELEKAEPNEVEKVAPSEGEAEELETPKPDPGAKIPDKETISPKTPEKKKRKLPKVRMSPTRRQKKAAEENDPSKTAKTGQAIFSARCNFR